MIPLIPIIAIGGGLVLAASAAEASAPLSSGGDSSEPIDFPVDYPSEDSSTPPIDYTPDMNAQISAFLAVIRAGESSNNYGALVGGGSFTDFSHHPATPPITFKGVINADGTPSHAAGAYQFQPGTWGQLASALHLADFGPASQDAGAIQLLRQRGAYDDIVMGDISSAVGKLQTEWQMFTLTRWNVSAVSALFESNGGYTA